MAYANMGSMAPTVLVTSDPDRAGNFVCNGTSDEVEINAALAFLTSGRTWKEKVVLRGSFNIADTIHVASYTILDMKQAMITLANGSNVPPVATPVTETDIEVIGGIIDGNKANQTAGQASLWFRDVTRGLIEDVYVYDSYDRGIEVDAGGYVLVHHVIVVDAGVTATGNGIMFWSGVMATDRHYKLTNAVVSGSNNNDIDCGTISDLHIDNVCSYIAEDNGIALDGSKIRLTNFQIIGDGTDPTWGLALANCTEVNVENGYVYYAAQHGIEVRDGYALGYVDITITNVIAESNVHVGIRVYDAASMTGYVTIRGCICISNTDDGIEIRNASFVVVIGCICHDNGANGIELAGAGLGGQDSIILGNICKDNTGTGILEQQNSDYNLIAWNNVRDGNGATLATVGANSMVRWNIGYNARELEVWTPIWDDIHAQASISNIGDHVSIMLAANQNSGVRFNISIPPDFHVLVEARMVVVATAADPTLRWSVGTDWGLCDEAYNTGSDAVVTHNDELTQNDIECLDFALALDGIVAGDKVGFRFWRSGADVADDAGDVHILGFYLQYV